MLEFKLLDISNSNSSGPVIFFVISLICFKYFGHNLNLQKTILRRIFQTGGIGRGFVSSNVTHIPNTNKVLETGSI